HARACMALRSGAIGVGCLTRTASLLDVSFSHLSLGAVSCAAATPKLVQQHDARYASRFCSRSAPLGADGCGSAMIHQHDVIGRDSRTSLDR
ncbi:hypothetical protein ABLN64_07985, partial [Mycobacterium tuberculosis]